MFGFINVYKPPGKTSHDVVAFLRRVLKIKQIGHTGTLDPFAEGVLPVCIGKATRLIEYLKDDKAYIATVQLGSSTTTYDLEGEIVNINETASVSEDKIKEALECFRGEIEQLPPIYSAIKVKGKKMYEYARKGEHIDIKPRRVFIKEIKILNYDSGKKQLELYIDCSKGTYIRSIANDLGEKLGIYGHLVKLTRVKAGDFKVEDSVRMEEIDSVEVVKKYMLNPVDYLNYPKYTLNEDEKEKISHGNSINIKTQDGTLVLMYKGEIAAIASVFDETAKCLKVFI